MRNHEKKPDKAKNVMASFGSLKISKEASEKDWKEVRKSTREEWAERTAPKGNSDEEPEI